MLCNLVGSFAKIAVTRIVFYIMLSNNMHASKYSPYVERGNTEMTTKVPTAKPWTDKPNRPAKDTLTLGGLARHPATRQFIQYIGVGGVAFLVDYFVFSMTLLAGGHYLWGTVFGFGAGVVTNYLLCLHWIWRGSQATTFRDITAFTLIGLAGLGISVALMYITVELLDAPPLLAKLSTAGVVLVWNFTLRKIFVFFH